MLQATLEDSGDSAAAERTVTTMRVSLAESSIGVLVGEITAVALGANTVAIHDRNLIITLMLVLLLVPLMQDRASESFWSAVAQSGGCRPGS